MISENTYRARINVSDNFTRLSEINCNKNLNVYLLEKLNNYCLNQYYLLLERNKINADKTESFYFSCNFISNYINGTDVDKNLREKFFNVKILKSNPPENGIYISNKYIKKYFGLETPKIKEQKPDTSQIMVDDKKFFSVNAASNITKQPLLLKLLSSDISNSLSLENNEVKTITIPTGKFTNYLCGIKKLDGIKEAIQTEIEITKIGRSIFYSEESINKIDTLIQEIKSSNVTNNAKYVLAAFTNRLGADLSI